MNPFKKASPKESTAPAVAASHPLLDQAAADQSAHEAATELAERQAASARKNFDVLNKRLASVEGRLTIAAETKSALIQAACDQGTAAVAQGDDQAAQTHFREAADLEVAPVDIVVRADKLMLDHLKPSIEKARAAVDVAEATANEARRQLELSQTELQLVTCDLMALALVEALCALPRAVGLYGVAVPLGLSRTFRAAKGMNRLELIGPLQIDLRNGRHAAMFAQRAEVLVEPSVADRAHAAEASRLIADQRGSIYSEGEKLQALMDAKRSSERV